MRRVSALTLSAALLFPTAASAQNAGNAEAETDQQTTNEQSSNNADASERRESRSSENGRSAAERRTANEGRQGDRAGQRGQRQDRGTQGFRLDQQIAGCLLLGNQSEIALAEFAQQKCKNQQCKDFAKMMIEQHRQAISKIEQAAPQVARKDLKLRNANLGGSQQQDGQESPSNANQQDGNLNPPMMLARQVKEECLAMTMKALGEKQGAEFDKAYITQQVMAHMAMLGELKGSEPFASEQLKPVIKDGMQMTEKHLQKAKDIMHQMKDGSSQQQANADQ